MTFSSTTTTVSVPSSAAEGRGCPGNRFPEVRRPRLGREQHRRRRSVRSSELGDPDGLVGLGPGEVEHIRLDNGEAGHVRAPSVPMTSYIAGVAAGCQGPGDRHLPSLSSRPSLDAFTATRTPSVHLEESNSS